MSNKRKLRRPKPAGQSTQNRAAARLRVSKPPNGCKCRRCNPDWRMFH